VLSKKEADRPFSHI